MRLETEMRQDTRLRTRQLPPPLRVVCLGGGTGMPAVLRGLRPYAATRSGVQRVQLTAIVTVADDGGSSGRLRRELGLLPPGDVRNCLVALAAPKKGGLRELFQYRFTGGEGLAGHTVGNLVLGALSALRGDFLDAVRVAGLLLEARGRVLPCTLRAVQLVADLDDGRRVTGEQAITAARGKVRKLELTPQSPPPAPGVLAAIEQADVIVLGPGSLFSSVLPNLLVAGVANAVAESKALKLLVLNLMTQPGETDGFSAVDHVKALQQHAGNVVDCVLAHSGAHPPELVARYAQDGAVPVTMDAAALAALGVRALPARIAASGKKIRHDPALLAAWILRLAQLERSTQERSTGSGS